MATPPSGRSRTLSAAPRPPGSSGEPPDIPATRRRGVLSVEVRAEDICAVRTPVAVVGRYLDTPAVGAMGGFDARLDGWLQKAIERGIICSLLGELAFIPTPRSARRSVRCDTLVVAGMGEVGRFAREDLAYLLSNVALATRLLGHGQFATVLIGTGNRGMSAARSARGIVEGVLAAFDHFPSDRGPRMGVTFCVRSTETAGEVWNELERIKGELRGGRDTVRLLGQPRTLPRSGSIPSRLPPSESSAPPNRVTITRPESSPATPAVAATPMVSLEYAALTSSAVVPLRTQQIQQYFLDRLPPRLRKRAQSEAEQGRLGELLAQYLVPNDMHGLIHGDERLVLTLDSQTAAIPWEMTCYRRVGQARFYGIDLQLTRQFRTTQTVPPGIAPPVNNHLRVLLIADPAGGTYRLPGARQEAVAVLRALSAASQVRGEGLSIRVAIRVGPPGTPQNEIDEIHRAIPPELVESAGPCDPIDVLGLLLNDSFDVIHYAGHGEFDPPSGRMGWVFDADCRLTAAEVLKVRRVPRLVFANACHSAEVTAGGSPLQMVGLAEAFFQHGVMNYLGTGWEVDDGLAVRFADAFYRAALGVDSDEPAVLSRAAAVARQAVRKESPADTTWGAYQFYGQPEAKLIRVEDGG